MTSDRYQRLDKALRTRLHRTPQHTLAERGLPADPNSQTLRGVIAVRRAEGHSFARIAREVSNLAGVDVTHETIRAWWRAIEAEIDAPHDGRTGRGQ
jgi:hypothetical protein